MQQVTRHVEDVEHTSTLGCRFVGIVVEVGDDVAGFAVGDAVMGYGHEENGFDGGARFQPPLS